MLKKNKGIVLLLLAGLMVLAAPGIFSTAAPARGENGWVTEEQKTYYYRDGKKVTGFQTIDSKRYFFDLKTGEQKTGFVKYKGKKYFFSPKKKEQRFGWVYYDQKNYYFGKNGAALKGIHQIGKHRYYFDKTGVMVKNALVRSRYYAGSRGRFMTGWQEENGQWYYFSPRDYRAITGWKRIGGKLCHFGDDGALVKHSGLTSSDRGFLYYFDPVTGETKKGWVHTEGGDYYFSQKTGRAFKGWHTIEGKKYYFNSDRVLARSQFIGSKYYVDEKGEKVRGWLTLNDQTYYFDPVTGVKYKSWKMIDGKNYHFNRTGQMDRNVWVKNRYLTDDGTLAVNTWIGAEEVGPNGYKTGKTRSPGLFTDRDGNIFYLDADFQNLTGWQTIENKTYHFNTETGIMDKNQWVEGYYLNDAGERVSGSWQTIDGKDYLFLADGSKAKGITPYEGKYYYFSTVTGEKMTGFRTVSNQTYYFDPEQNGAMAVSTELEIDGAFYTFDEKGHMTAKDNPVANEALGKQIALYAQKFIGYPYAWGGASDLKKGVDCSGFVMLVMRHFGIQIPRVTWDQHNGVEGYQKPLKIAVENLKPGDLIFYNSCDHVGIYIGDGKIVHASNANPYPEGGIKISDYDYSYIYGCVRYWY